MGATWDGPGPVGRSGAAPQPPKRVGLGAASGLMMSTDEEMVGGVCPSGFVSNPAPAKYGDKAKTRAGLTKDSSSFAGLKMPLELFLHSSQRNGAARLYNGPVTLLKRFFHDPNDGVLLDVFAESPLCEADFEAVFAGSGVSGRGCSQLIALSAGVALECPCSLIGQNMKALTTGGSRGSGRGHPSSP